MRPGRRARSARRVGPLFTVLRSVVSVSIGDVSLKVRKPKRPELVPTNYGCGSRRRSAFYSWRQTAAGASERSPMADAERPTWPGRVFDRQPRRHTSAPGHAIFGAATFLVIDAARRN